MTIFFKIIVYFSIIYYVAHVHGVEAPSVYIPNQGLIIGTYLKMYRTQNIKAYLGIRYAEAQRFAPPDITKLRWAGVYNATMYSPDCWQKSNDKSNFQPNNALKFLINKKQTKRYDENCLNLNVYIPDGIPGSNGYAVIVWFHGGDFSLGSANDVDPFQLVFKQNVIVVTVSYRLSIFGFLSTGDGECQGNFGLMDQSAALFWIKSYINHFGGDSKQITLMGHTAGAISVGLHLTSGEWSRGAFNKIIMMSGHPLLEDVVNMPSKYDNVLDQISSIFGCIRRPTSMLIQCLRRIEPKIIIENIPNSEWGPVIDFGLSNTSFPFIEEYPVNAFKNGRFQNVPVLIGITDEYHSLGSLMEKYQSYTFGEFIQKVANTDFRNAVNNDEWCTNFQIVEETLHYMYENRNQSLDETDKNNYVKFQYDRYKIAPLYLLIDLYSQIGNVYVYEFNIKQQAKFDEMPEMSGIQTYSDQLFIWGVPFMDKGNFVSEWTSNDKKRSEVIMTLWANFAKTSNPTKTNVYIKWSTYHQFNQSILVIDENFHLKIFSKPQIVDFWNNFYPKVIKYAVECCNVTNNGHNFFKLKTFLYITTILVFVHIMCVSDFL